MKFLPLFHRAAGQHWLIVGGGLIALRRAKTVCKTGAIVDVIAPQIDDRLAQLVADSGGQCRQRNFMADDLGEQYHYVIAATDQAAVNAQVAELAKARRTPVNVADNQSLCDFIFSSVIDRAPLTIAISNSGQSPVLSRLLKQQIEMFVPSAYGKLADLFGHYRAQVSELIPDSARRTAFWEAVLQGGISEAVFSGKSDEAIQLFERALQQLTEFEKKGEVYLIGAGPGDPDLLTLRAFRLIQQAEVVVYDRLVSEGVLALLKDDVEKVYVGKQRSDHSVPQEGINQLLIDYAKQGKRVARLKGGDPFIFGRGGEEIETLAEQQIPFQVVPGITAANGCSSYAGIPLTHRDYAQSVQFVTGQQKDGVVDLNWSEFVREDKTIVFYMGLNSLPYICQQLMAHGVKPDMQVALIEKGTSQDQRVFVSTVSQLEARLEAESVSSPSLFIVGRVVQLADKLKWFGQ
ncbi:MAG: siroheme synthase CysG [Motiliproteus sp.]